MKNIETNKGYGLILLILIGLVFSCHHEIAKPNHFSSENDTLFINTKKLPGQGMFETWAAQITFQDLNTFDHYPVITPDSISEIKIGLQIIDWKIYRYFRYKKGEISNEFVIKDISKNKLDTTLTHSIKNNSICILSGKMNDNKIFIVDENNNKDFRDDSIRVHKEIGSYPQGDNLIKCYYKIYDEKKIIEDSTWLNIGTSRGKLLLGVAQNLISTFSINDTTYQLGISTKSSDFCYDAPIAALISENGIKKDSILKSEIIHINEYLELNNQYYKFESITNDGSKIKLIKEEDVSDKIGTQVGFVAPNFNCLSTKKDTISLKDYKGESLLLANITSCYSPISSYQYYKELYEQYAPKVKILAIDNSPNFLKFQINKLDLKGDFIISSENKSIEKNYRQDFCSRTCFLISPEGLIVDKFEIADWKSILSMHFE